MLVRFCGAVVAATFLFVQGALADYILRPGDTVRLSYIGLPEVTSEGTISTDGAVRFPLIGTLEAGGKTIQNFEFDAQEASLGRRYSARGEAGVSISVELGGFEIFAEIAKFAPVYVVGDVLRPGEIEFHPGMTIRSAIAKAGGTSLVPSSDSNAKLIADEITNQRLLAQGYTQTIADIWRIEALLERDADWPEPDVSDAPADTKTLATLIDARRALLVAEMADYNVRLTSLRETIDGIENAQTMIVQQIDQNEAVVEGDRVQLGKVEELIEKGLADNNRIANAQRAFATSSSQRLDLLRSLTESNAGQSELEIELAELERSFSDDLLLKKVEMEAQLEELKIKLDGSKEILGGRDYSSINSADLSNPDVRIVRDIEGEAQVQTLALDGPAFPGDIIEVGLSLRN